MPLQHPKKPYSPREQAGGDEVFMSEAARVPAHVLPAGEMRGEVAYQIVHDDVHEALPFCRSRPVGRPVRPEWPGRVRWK